MYILIRRNGLRRLVWVYRDYSGLFDEDGVQLDDWKIVDLDQTKLSVASDLGLHGLLRYIG